MSVSEQEAIELKAFLSHHYKSPNVNLFFFKLLSEHARVHFEVDIGTKPTSVTRLERMIRDSDSFIGLYPFPRDPIDPVKYSELVVASRYFRLELDIAVRAHKPILVFSDQRYREVLNLPEIARIIPFDIQEITGTGASPQGIRYSQVIADFFRFVRAVMLAEAKRPVTSPRTKVGLIAPTGGRGPANYTDDEVQAIKRVAHKNQIPELHVPPGPWVLDGRMYRWLDSLDWAIADVGEATMKTGIIGYLHGSLVPMVRLCKGVESVEQVERKAVYKCLFGGVEVGYRKDIVFWRSKATLERELAKRLQILYAPVRRIPIWESAEEYFMKASLRNESVFVSYSGKDRETARKITNLLKHHFQEVFDYRDGESIVPGQPWLKQIFDQLAKSALGVPLITEDYLASGNCIHEAQEMVAQQDSGRMVVIPIKLDSAKLDLPTWMRNRQYLRLCDHRDIESAVRKLIECFDLGLTSSSTKA